MVAVKLANSAFIVVPFLDIFVKYALHLQFKMFFIFPGKQTEVEKEMEQVNHKPKIDVRLTDLKLVLGPELRILYPLILDFTLSGELELNGIAHPKLIKPKGVLTFENGEVNLVATQVTTIFPFFCLVMIFYILVHFFSLLDGMWILFEYAHTEPFQIQVRLKKEHLNIAKFEPDNGLDPSLDLAFVGSEWQFSIQSRASNWQDNLVVTSTRSVEQNVLSPTEVKFTTFAGFSFSSFFYQYL